jgi:CBS-domain-containing membrane protein
LPVFASADSPLRQPRSVATGPEPVATDLESLQN